MPELSSQDFRNALGLQPTLGQPGSTEEPVNPAIANALTDVTGVTTVLSPWNSFWREANLAGPEFTRALVTGLSTGYENMTGTGQRFSDRSPDQLRASIQEAQYKLADINSQYPSASGLYARGGLDTQKANINADVEGMQHQLALKTGAVKPGFADNMGDTIKWLNDQMTKEIDEARGLKTPSPRSPISMIPVIGPLLGEAPSPSPAEINDPLSQFAGGLGSLLGNLPLYGSGNVPTEFSAIALQRYQAARDEAKANGADLAGQARAGAIGLLAGVAEAPLYRTIFGKFVGHEVPRNVGELTQKLVKNFAAGAGLGVEQQAASNMIAVFSGYDPNRKVTDGLIDSSLQQAAMFGLAGGLVDTPSYLLHRFGTPNLDPYRKAGQERTEPPEEGVAPPIQPQPVTPTPSAPLIGEQLAEQLARAARPEAEAPPERIVAAAVRQGETIGEGPTHGHAIEDLQAKGGKLSDEDILRYYETGTPAGAEYGFLTDSGRFVGREEAQRISGATGPEAIHIVPQEAAPMDLATRVRDAYQQLKNKQGGLSAVSIGGLAGRAGVPIPELHQFLLGEARAGRADLHPTTLREADLSPEQRSGALQVPGLKEPAISATLREPTPAPDIGTRILNAYQQVRSESTSPYVYIHDVVTRSGVPEAQAKEWIGNHPQIQLAEGDWGAARTEAERRGLPIDTLNEGGVELAGRNRTLMDASGATEPAAARITGEAEPGAPQAAPRAEVPGELAAAARAAQEVRGRYADQVHDELTNLTDRLGPRFGFRIMRPEELPNRYKLALAQQGIDPRQYSAFYDKGFDQFYVNPNGFDSRAELNDAIIRKFIPNAFANKASIHTVNSYRDVAESPGIAALLAERPDSDRTTPGLYDKVSGNVYLNVPRLLADPDPLGQALKTAVHETNGHQGIRTWYGTDSAANDAFLDRVFTGMRNTGAGDRIASRFGMNMNQLADHYGFDLATDVGRRQLAEELLARYSEQFDPAQLDRAPSVVRRAVGLLRANFLDKQGLTFNERDALDFLKGAWRHTDPELALKTALRPGEAITPEQKRIGEYGETTLADAASDALNRAEALDAARASSRGPITNEQAHGTPSPKQSVLAAGEKLLREGPAQGLWLDPTTLEKLKSRRLGEPGVETTEHNAWLTDHGYVLKETRADSELGPYGLLPALPGRTVRPAQDYYTQPSERYAVTAASPSQYHSSYDLRNEIFPGFQTHFEGYTGYDGDSVARIVTSQPFLDETIFRPSGETQRNAIMANHGFTPIDDRVYYNPNAKVVAYDIHNNNLLVNKDNPNDFRVIDGSFARVHGQLADHFAELLRNNTYEQFNLDRAQAELEARGRETTPTEGYEEELRAWAEQQPALEARATTNTETVMQDRDKIQVAPPVKAPEEKSLPNLFNLIGAKREEAVPQEVLDQIKATLTEQKPSQGVRYSAIKGTLNPDAPDAVRARSASPSQLLYERDSRPAQEKQVNGIYSDHLGDLDTIIDAYRDGSIAKGYGEAVDNVLYSRINKDILELYNGSIDPARRQQLEQVMSDVNKTFYERGTAQGQALQSRADTWYGANGILNRYNAAVAKETLRNLRADPNFKAAVQDVRSILGEANQDVSDKLKNLFLTADKFVADNSWKSLPQQYADWVANNVTNQALRAGLSAREVPALEELFNRFRQTITGLAKENGIEMDRPAREKMSATDRITEATSNWAWFSNTLKDTVDQAQKTFADKEGDSADTLAYKAKMRDLFTNLGTQADIPFTEAQLAKFLPERQVRISDLVNQHRSRIATTIDSLRDYLLRNSNLNPEQSQLIENAVASHLQSAIDVRRQAEFERIIRDSAGKRYNPEGSPVSMQRLINLIHMGAFEDPAVADALAPSFGYKSYDPEFVAELRRQGDDLEALSDSARKGFQGEQIRQEMLRQLNLWRMSSYGPWGKARGQMRSIFMANLLTGLETHWVAGWNDFFEGAGTMGGFIARLPTNEAKMAAIARIPGLWWDGLVGEGGGFDRFRKVMASGVDPNRPVTIADMMEMSGGEPGYVPRTNDVPLTGWLKPLDYVFRGVSAFHAMMRNPAEESIEWLYALHQIAERPNTSITEALNGADQAINGNAEYRAMATETAKSEGFTPGSLNYRIRVQEIIDQNRPPEVSEVGKLFGTRSIFTQAPDGLLGALARTMQSGLREVPGLRYLVPFTNVVANVVNSGLNWSGRGFLLGLNREAAERYFEHTLGQAPTEEMRETQLNLLRADALSKAAVGTSALFALWAFSRIPGPNGKPLIDITGNGPSDTKKRYQEMDSGWLPNAIGFNLPWLARPYYIPFEATPIAPGLSLIGNVEDSFKYNDGQDALPRLMDITKNTVSSILDRTFLRGIKDALDSIGGEADAHKGAESMMKLTQSWIASQTPYLGSVMAQHLYRYFDPTLYAKGTGTPIAADLLRDLPFANWIDGSKPMLNALGEPITSWPMRRAIGQLASQDPIWSFLDRNNLFLSDGSTAKIEGQRMTPEQRYWFTKYRGQYLKGYLNDNLEDLDAPDLDPETRQKMLERFGEEATRAAKEDVISGRND